MESHTKVFEALLRPEALQGLLRPYKATSGPHNFIRPVSSFRTLALLRSKRFERDQIQRRQRRAKNNLDGIYFLMSLKNSFIVPDRNSAVNFSYPKFRESSSQCPQSWINHFIHETEHEIVSKIKN